MFDSYKAIENIQKYIDSNYKQMEDNVKLSSKPFYNPYHQIIKHDMKTTHKPYGDFAQKVGSKQPKIRNFPVDYCEICQRKTGTDMYSGECGGCLMDVLLKSRKSNLGGELEPLTWKELFWGTVIVVAIAIITVEVVTRISSLF